jgi:lysozyme family protein
MAGRFTARERVVDEGQLHQRSRADPQIRRWLGRSPGRSRRSDHARRHAAGLRPLAHQERFGDAVSIDENELQAIYKIQYWDLIHGDKLPSGIDAAVFDFAVNSGATRATQELQRVLKLRTDGNMGAVTIEACNQADTENLIVSYCDARLAFVKKLSTFGTFGRGWKRRITAVREACLDMVSGDTRRVSFMSGDEDDAAMAAHADVRDIAPSSTLVVKGSAATGLGIAGASLTETAEKLSWVSEYSGVLMGLFVALMVAGIGLTVYAQIRSIKNETPE